MATDRNGGLDEALQAAAARHAHSAPPPPPPVIDALAPGYTYAANGDIVREAPLQTAALTDEPPGSRMAGATARGAEFIPTQDTASADDLAWMAAQTGQLTLEQYNLIKATAEQEAGRLLAVSAENGQTRLQIQHGDDKTMQTPPMAVLPELAQQIYLDTIQSPTDRAVMEEVLAQQNDPTRTLSAHALMEIGDKAVLENTSLRVTTPIDGNARLQAGDEPQSPPLRITPEAKHLISTSPVEAAPPPPIIDALAPGYQYAANGDIVRETPPPSVVAEAVANPELAPFQGQPITKEAMQYILDAKEPLTIGIQPGNAGYTLTRGDEQIDVPTIDIAALQLAKDHGDIRFDTTVPSAAGVQQQSTVVEAPAPEKPTLSLQQSEAFNLSADLNRGMVQKDAATLQAISTLDGKEGVSTQDMIELQKLGGVKDLDALRALAGAVAGIRETMQAAGVGSATETSVANGNVGVAGQQQQQSAAMGM